ncbi:multidrug effflux MFS transporter [Gammaproteobacteria bacterium]|nr:multidrug effflux MFS transporter [Gammaproteobacteria bacterium]
MNEQEQAEKIPLSFIALMAVLMSLTAISIDAMLPALGQIGEDLAVQNPNDVQLVISSLFVGLAIGILFFGPFADSFGRKKAIYLGISIFLFGCIASIFSNSFEIMLLGRVLQGFGTASCRIATMCMIRDKFEGNAMARIMSFIMIIFILSPALAPSLGQVILLFAHWRVIFIVMFFIGISSVAWLAIRQEETLKPENRHPFKIRPILHAVHETVNNKISRGYTIASGIIFGAFVGYLNSAQQILQEQYALGGAFAVVFGFLALALGIASFANSRWVYKYGMEKICHTSLLVMVGATTIFLPISLFFNGNPPLILLIIYLLIVFFCCGLLFGNFNTMAIHPLGHIAGAASSVIGCIQTLLSASLGATIGYLYNGTINPLIIGFFILGIWSFLLVSRLGKSQQI